METIIHQSPLWLVVIFLLVGFAALIKGADFFVDGSSSLAKKFKIPSLIIGLTIVSMGTSLPEAAVSSLASFSGNNALAVSNAVGSSIFNTVVVIGFCALMCTIPISEATIKRDIPVSALATLGVLLFGYLAIWDKTGMVLGRIDGILLLVAFLVYLVVLVQDALASVKEGQLVDVERGEENIQLMPIPKSLLFIIGGGIAIALGGDVTVSAASRIASDFGMSPTLVGLTIVSIGTSLPELVISIIAARKNEIGMALGNAIGSNVFNLLMVLGIASTISPITFLSENLIDLLILLLITAIVWFFALTKKKLDRREGAIMLVIYAVYLTYAILR